MTELSWIDAMQEEIHEFQRLEVWELVPCPDKVLLIKLKWIYKVKSDEFGWDTPMVEKSNMDEDLQGTPINATLYRGMIGSLVYLTSSRPDLIYAVCLCACMGLWYLKDTGMSMTAYADADHAGCQDTRRSTSGSAQFLVENGIVELYFVRIEYQPDDIFTKPLPRERFNFLIEKLRMRSMTLETLKRLAEETDE
ncbi:hypothetical protein Tco_0054107 [Tanacetum coccineum]